MTRQLPSGYAPILAVVVGMLAVPIGTVIAIVIWLVEASQ